MLLLFATRSEHRVHSAGAVARFYVKPCDEVTRRMSWTASCECPEEEVTLWRAPKRCRRQLTNHKHPGCLHRLCFVETIATARRRSRARCVPCDSKGARWTNAHFESMLPVDDAFGVPQSSGKKEVSTIGAADREEFLLCNAVGLSVFFCLFSFYHHYLEAGILKLRFSGKLSFCYLNCCASHRRRRHGFINFAFWCWVSVSLWVV